MKTTTACCALAQINGIGNNTPIADIRKELDLLKEESKEVYVPGDTSGRGQRAVFVITTPDETLLRANLKVLGFKKVHTFSRRKGYPDGKLKMYIKNI